LNVLLDVGLLSLVMAIAGARALHLAFHLEQVTSWRDVVALPSGGLSMYGGVLAAMGACWLYFLLGVILLGRGGAGGGLRLQEARRS
jgi:prolipoprotein diacylglyceryltransferase